MSQTEMQDPLSGPLAALVDTLLRVIDLARNAEET